MADVGEFDRACGLEVFSTDTEGTGGTIKAKAEDFNVEEVPVSLSEGEGYLLCSLRKKNMTTFDAVSVLSSRLGCSKDSISYAGIKDRRAVTEQMITLRDVSKEEVHGLNIDNIELNVIKEVSDPLGKGDLKGNRFDVTLRDVDLSMKECGKRVGKIKDEISDGILNFYGTQRFGSQRPVSHLVGRELLRRNFEDAVMTYLTETFPREPDKFRDARNRLGKERDFSQAVDYFPQELKYERKLLKSVSGLDGISEKDWLEAFNGLPGNLKRIFVHAYQSYLFNTSLSELYRNKGKLKNFPAKVVGYSTPIKDSKFDRVLREKLKEDGIKPEDFRFNSLGKLSSKGAVRASMIEQNIDVGDIEGDELNTDRLKLSVKFKLKPSRYATVVLREITKN